MQVAERPKLLFLAHRVPYPPDKGDRIRTYQMLRWLSQRASVSLACLADEPVDPQALAVLNGLADRVSIIPNGGGSRWLRMLSSLASGGTASEGAFASRGLAAVMET